MSSYTDTLDKKHTGANGHEVDVGHIRTFNYGFAAAYSPTDRLMFAASLPLVRSRYYGPDPHPTTTDNGEYHSTFTDLRTEVHYQLLLNDVWALAPYAAYVLPTHTYAVLGHAAPGRGLDELWLGLSAGSEPGQVDTAHVRQRNVHLRRGRARAGHLARQGEHRRQRGVVRDSQRQRAGVRELAEDARWPEFTVPPSPANPLFPYHDQLAAAGYTNVGIGGSWDYSDRSTIFAGLHGRPPRRQHASA